MRKLNAWLPALLVSSSLLAAAGCGKQGEDSEGSGGGPNPLPEPADEGVKELSPKLPASVRRLTNLELAQTTRDLFGIEELSVTFPPESSEAGSDRISQTQSVGPVRVEGYFKFASDVAASITANDELLGEMFSCDPATLGPRGRIPESLIPAASLGYALDEGSTFGHEVDAATGEVTIRYTSVTGVFTFTHNFVADVEHVISVDMDGGDGDYYITVDGNQVGENFGDGANEVQAVTYIGPGGPLEVGIHIPPTESALHIREARVSGVASDWTPTEEAAACVDEFLDGYAARIFRRPLTGGQKDRLRAVYEAGIAENLFFEGFSDVLRSMLMSPNFLYHIEKGEEGDPGVFALDDYEIASRLSYTFWESVPDDALWDLADNGGLMGDSDAIGAQAARLFNDDRTRETIKRFYSGWLQLEDIDTTNKDPELFPAFNAEMKVSMRTETETFMEQMIWSKNSGLREILTSDKSYVDATLADLYGIDAPSEDFGEVTLPKERRGILGHAGILAMTSAFGETLPVKRGKYVLTNILCLEPEPPPPTVNITRPEPDDAVTTRERWAQHSTDAVCRGCHSVMDPVGFALEAFDPIGVYRTEENGLEIDSSGGIPDLGIADGELAEPAELMEAIGASDVSLACFAQRWLQFSLGRLGREDDDKSVRQLAGVLAAEGGTVQDMLVAAVLTESFTRRVTPE